MIRLTLALALLATLAGCEPTTGFGESLERAEACHTCTVLGPWIE